MLNEYEFGSAVSKTVGEFFKDGALGTRYDKQTSPTELSRTPAESIVGNCFMQWL